MNLWSDFIRLKTAIGGNRELVNYEYTFGMPQEELAHITMPNIHNRRIINQLEFAIRLSEAQGGSLNNVCRQTLEFLLQKMEEEGVLSKTACCKAEQLLLPCQKTAKEYKLILAGHAHIDMDWMWSYQETVAITLSTFRTVLNLMQEYPDFCFSQSQASVYKIVEEYAPEMMSEIQARIQEGRWEVTASAWVETDKNMPNTESLLRHIQYTKYYLAQTWGIDAEQLEIDFSPDTFGHSANIPEIDSFGGVKYMYHCRALDGDQSLYRWRSPSGKELLVYREQYWYNSGITPQIGLGLIDIAQELPDFKTGLIVYGVGDHGGGPTRRDIEAAIEMANWPVFPQIKFGTFREFFHEAEAIREKLPIIDRELNYFATGCYTTQSRIKLANRKAEACLTDAEAMMAFAKIEANRIYRDGKHQAAWQNVLYAHFHDIITGSCVQDSREHAMGQFSNTMAYAQTQYSQSAAAIAAMIDTSSISVDSDVGFSQAEGAGGGFSISNGTGMPIPSSGGLNVGFNNGVPNPERGCGKVRIFNIFNPIAAPRKTATEITVWDWTGDMRRIQVHNTNGTPLRFQLLDNMLEHYWDHKFFRILIEADLPALGYTTVILSEAEATAYPLYRQPQLRSSYPYPNYVLENELVRAVFHRVSGCLISLIDKESGREYIETGKTAGPAIVTMQLQGCDAWSIGKYLNIQPLTAPVNIAPLQGGNLQQRFTAEYHWGMSTIKVTPILAANEKAIRFCVEADWSEVSGQTVPLLIFDVPFAFRTQKFLCDVPGGSQYRAPMAMDMPGLQYCAAIGDDGAALALIPDSKYGYRASEDRFSVTLINTSTAPDPYPERGIHTINIALAISADCPKLLEETATQFNHTPYYLSNNAHKGSLPSEMSFLALEAKTSVLSAVLPTPESDVIHVRLYETCGKDDKVVLKLAKAPANVVSVDLSGRTVPSDAAIVGNTISASVKANTIAELQIHF